MAGVGASGPTTCYANPCENNKAKAQSQTDPRVAVKIAVESRASANGFDRFLILEKQLNS